MTNASERAPTTPASSSDTAGLLTLTYDATGLQSVALQLGPLAAWAFDISNPTNPATVPIGISNMSPVPPNTAPILSPQLAVIYPPGIVFTQGEMFCGSFADFLLWLSTNNDANRTLTNLGLATPLLTNAFNDFARLYPDLAPGAVL